MEKQGISFPGLAVRLWARDPKYLSTCQRPALLHACSLTRPLMETNFQREPMC